MHISFSYLLLSHNHRLNDRSCSFLQTVPVSTETTTNALLLGKGIIVFNRAFMQFFWLVLIQMMQDIDFDRVSYKRRADSPVCIDFAGQQGRIRSCMEGLFADHPDGGSRPASCGGYSIPGNWWRRSNAAAGPGTGVLYIGLRGRLCTSMRPSDCPCMARAGRRRRPVELHAITCHYMVNHYMVLNRITCMYSNPITCNYMHYIVITCHYMLALYMQLHAIT